MSANKEIVLKGNELGWIIKLAQEHLISESFQRYMSVHNIQTLQPFLYGLMGRFHEANFYAGDSRTTWVLIRKEEVS